MKAIALIAGLVALGVVTLAVLVWHVDSSPEGRAAMRTLEKATAAARGPGVAALSKAGCRDVVVLPVDDLKMLEHAQGKPADPSPADVWITCSRTAQLVTCDGLAALWTDAEHPKGPFQLTVATQEAGAARATPQCGGLYGVDGALMATPPARPQRQAPATP